MEKIIKVVIGLIAVVALGLGFVAVNKQTSTIVEQVGAMPGPDHTEHQIFRTSFTNGGYVASSTSNTAETLTAPYLNNIATLVYTPNVSAVTLTLPASSSLQSFVPSKGDIREILFRNSTSTAGINLTVAGNTGVILRGVHGTSSIAYAGRGIWLRFWRSSTSTDIYVTSTPE